MQCGIGQLKQAQMRSDLTNKFKERYNDAFNKNFTPWLLASILSTPAMAQTVPEHGVFVLNSLLFLIGGFLVMFMACGFCMLEAGLVRAKIQQLS